MSHGLHPNRDGARVDCWRCGTRHYCTAATEPTACVLCGAAWLPRVDTSLAPAATQETR